MNEDFVKEEQLTNNTNTKQDETQKNNSNNETITNLEKPKTETPTNDEEPSSEKEDKSQPELPTDKPLDETNEEETADGVSNEETSEEKVEPESEETVVSDDKEAEAASDEEALVIDTNVEMEEALDAFKGPNEGDVVKGKVVKINSDEVMVDIGYKSEGYISITEFDKRPDGSPDIDVGDEIDVYLMRKEDADGLIVLSKEIANQKLVWEKIANAYREGTPIEVKISKRIKGGFRVKIEDMPAFLPASQVDLYPVSNFEDYIGKTLEMKVIKLSKPRRNIVLSRRVLLEEELEKKKAKLLNSLEKGQIQKGVVKNITDFGAFVDLGGVDGLLHRTDMSWGRVNHPSEKVSKGDELEVKILDVNKEEEKVSLGLKQKTPDPWLSVEEKYPEGSVVEGKVVNITDYGAFVELEEGVEGLLHVSEMSWSHRLTLPSNIVNKGDKIEVKVLKIDTEDRRISLSLKELQPNPWETLEERYPPGSKIRGKVRNITDFGAFVEIEEGIDGLVHVSDMSWAKRMVDPADILKEGDEVEVRVMSIDAEKQRVSLSLRHTKPDPWLKAPEKYKVDTVVKGKIVNLTDFGAFAKLEDGVEGLIHISELSEHHVEKVKNVVSVGDELNLKVINVDLIERKIGLSLKAYQAKQQDTVPVSKYQKQLEKKPSTTLGVLLKEELTNAIEKEKYKD